MKELYIHLICPMLIRNFSQNRLSDISAQNVIIIMNMTDRQDRLMMLLLSTVMNDNG